MNFGSDDFEDDDLFNDPGLLAEVEAHAITATQAPRLKDAGSVRGQPGPASDRFSKAPVFGYTRQGKPIHEPRPVNTEPRVSKGAFGFGDLGKFDGLSDLAHGDLNGYPRRKTEQDGDYPQMFVDSDGKYGYESSDEAEVIDKRAQTISETLAVQAKPPPAPQTESNAQARRRAALVGETATLAPQAVLNDRVGPPAPRLYSGRSFSRSASAGPNLFARPAHAGPSRLEPILSQGSHGSQLPSSQGAAARKAVFALEEESRRREAVEKELAEARAELERERRQRRDRETAPAHWPGIAEDEDMTDADLQQKFRDLEKELWTARGEAETMRRAYRNDQERHANEVANLARDIADARQKMQEQARDTAQQLESMKTQAVFNNHAVYNSAVKARSTPNFHRDSPAGPRGSVAPTFDGSPRRRGAKGKEFAGFSTPASKPQKRDAGFPGLFNAFEADTKSAQRRAKFPKVVHMESPPRSQHNADQPPEAPSSSIGNGGSEFIHDDLATNSQWRASLHAPPPASVDMRAEFLHHLFSYSSASFAVASPINREPDLYRIVRHSSSDKMEPKYGQLCSDLLRACGDLAATWVEMLQSVGECLLGLAWICSQPLDAQTPLRADQILALVTVLNLFASTADNFRDLVNNLPDSGSTISDVCGRIARRAFAPLAADQLLRSARLDTRDTQYANGNGKSKMQTDLELAPSAVLALAQSLGTFCQAICCSPSGGRLWVNGTLVTVISSMARTQHDGPIASRGVDLFCTAALHRSNFRALMGSTALNGRDPADQPVVDEMAKMLGQLAQQREADETLRRVQSRLLRGFWALSVADVDAVLLIAQRSPLVPALVQVILREAVKIVGIEAQPQLFAAALEMLQSALRLLHHLTYPLPYAQLTTLPSTQHSESQPTRKLAADLPSDGSVLPQGVNLAARLSTAALTRDHNGIHHSFQAALGPIAYGEIDLPRSLLVGDGTKSMSVGCRPAKLLREQLRSLQYLSQDLIEATMEGPEVDAIYELYADETAQDSSQAMAAEDAVDPEAYDDAMNVDHE